MDKCVCMAESLSCSPATITTLFINQLHPKKTFFFFLSYILKKFAGDYPGSMVVKNLPSKGRMQVQPLVGELRSHTPQQEAPAPQRRHSTAKKNFLIKISK